MEKTTIALIAIVIILVAGVSYLFGLSQNTGNMTLNISNNTTNDSGYSGTTSNDKSSYTTKTSTTKKNTTHTNTDTNNTGNQTDKSNL